MNTVIVGKIVARFGLITTLFAGIIMFSIPAKAATDYQRYNYQKDDVTYSINMYSTSDDGDYSVGIGSYNVVQDRELVVFGPDKTKPLWTYAAPNDHQMFDAHISADGSTIVVCGGTVWLLDTASQSVIWEYEENAYVFDTCAISDNGKKVFAGARQSSIFKWNRSSAEPEKIWMLSDGGFVDFVRISGNGRRLLTSNGYSYAFINNTNQDNFAWEKSTTKEIYEVGLNNNGAGGYIIIKDGTAGSDNYKLHGLKTKSVKTRWTKKFKSYNTPHVAMSDNGKRLALATNDQYYGLNGKTGKEQWLLVRDGLHATVDMSANGKYVVITEGLDYTYMFDWAYPKKRQRPFQISQGSFPDSATISGDGSTMAFGSNDMRFEQLVPGVLLDNLDLIPVYAAGEDIKLRHFITNPGQKKTLKVLTSVSLPQISFSSDLGDLVYNEPGATKSKLLDYTNSTLPGYDILDERTITLDAHASTKITQTYEMPDLAIPSWFSSLLDTLTDILDVFGELLGMISEPLGDLVNTEVLNNITEGVNAVKENFSYPMLGYGNVVVYDPDTDEIYSQDSFFFMYVL